MVRPCICVCVCVCVCVQEGSGHEVGFQPYVRGDASACAYGATRPPGAPASGSSDFSPRPDPLTAQLLQLAAADLSPAELLRLAGGSSPLGMSPRSSASVALGGCSPPMRGGSPLLSGRRDSGDVMQGGSGGSSICGEEDVTGVSWADMEQAELAFDVYKVRRNTHTHTHTHTHIHTHLPMQYVPTMVVLGKQ